MIMSCKVYYPNFFHWFNIFIYMNKRLRVLLREELAFKGEINEVDWEDTFQDVKKTCMSHDALAEYLNKVRANAGKHTNDREKFSPDKPYFHAKSHHFNDENEALDVDSFIANITAMPNHLVNDNEKMRKSGGPHQHIYKTGVPALRGLVYDIEKGKFFVINTCPGAGSCIAICYARKGNYIRYQASYDNMTKRLNLLLNDPKKYEVLLYDELKTLAIEHKALAGYKSEVILRWNDSGDFFTKKYVEIAERVMNKLQADGYNVRSYAYTKVGDVANNSELDLTFSAGANKREMLKVYTDNQKVALVIPKDVFKGLDLMKVADEQELKKRATKFFNLNPNDVITYDEMMQTPTGEEAKLHVIVTPEDGDDAAFRPDVKSVLLTQH